MTPASTGAATRGAVLLTLGTLLACRGQPAPAAQPAAAPEPATAVRPVFASGMAQVVPAFQDTATWIRQHLWVETDVDTDRDGRNDRVFVNVTRPAQTDSGLRVPVIYQSSPYFAGVAQTFAFWDVRQELGADSPKRGTMVGPRYQGQRTRISAALVGTWVPRGFAVVHSEATGTGRSQGCPTVGDYPERAPMKFVIDWLNGRATGYSAPVGGAVVSATSWSTGKVGMIGTSYEGTLPIAAAVTGVEGLEVIVPVSPNTSYYHYYRANGLVRSPGGYLGEDVDVLYDFVASGDTATRPMCDRLWKNGVFAQGQDRRTGDYNDFWAARDLLPLVKNIRAAVLLGHGLNDWNVMPSHSVRIYEELKRQGKPVALFMHPFGHGGNPPADLVNRWFSHYLYGMDNGVPGHPSFQVVETIPARPAPGQPFTPPAPRSYASFPVPGSQPVRLHPVAGGTAIGALSTTASAGVDTLVDDVSVSGSANAAMPRSPHRLMYATAPLGDTIRVSGTTRVTLRVAASKPAANLSVWLVTLPYDTLPIGSQGYLGVVTRGWADPQNHRALTQGGDFSSKQPGEPLVPGRFYDVIFDLEPDHQVIPPGKRLALMVMSSDREFTLWPSPGTRLMLDVARSSVTIPVVGGREALARAGAIR